MGANWILSSDHGGWGYNSAYEYFHQWLCDKYTAISGSRSAPPSLLLVTNAFFDMSYDTAMFTNNPSGSTVRRKAIGIGFCQDAIPALTLPLGANP